MTHTSCPTAVVNAPIEVVWSLLNNTAGWGEFFDLRMTAVIPPGPAAVGQILEADTGPLGLRIRDDMRCRALDTASCRVTYN